jgi:hypothetical protein
MFHLALYDASIANGAVLLQIAAVSDVFIAPAGNGFLVNGMMPRLMRAASVGTNLTRTQLSSATLRDYAPFDLNPANVGTAIETPAKFQDWSDNPKILAVNEELDAFGVQSNAGAQRITQAVWFCDGPIKQTLQPEFTMHWTASATLGVNAWTGFAVTFDNGLPSGTFAILGARTKSAGALFFRFIPRGGLANRPGGWACQAQDDGTDPAIHGTFGSQRGGGLGEWMRFTNTTPPQVEMFSRSADASEEGYIDLLQVG